MLAVANTKIWHKFFLTIFCLGLFLPSLAKAEGSAISLTPFLVEEDAKKGAVLEKEFLVTNNSGKTKLLNFSIQDFVPLGKDGGAEFLPVGKSSGKANTLAEWVEVLQQPDFVLTPGQSSKARVSIKIPADAEAGSHFGALVFGLSDQYPSPGTTVIRQQAAALVILDVDRSFEKGSITSFKLDPAYDAQKEIKFQTEFFNEGLSSLKPKGKIILYDWLNRPVKILYVNPDALTVLPSSSRIFISAGQGKFWGPYRAELTLTYGSKKLQARTLLRLWIWPDGLFMLRFGLGVLLAAALLTFAIKRYNRWVINRRS